MARHGLHQHDLTGMSPGIAPPTLIRLLRQVKKDKLSYADFGRRAAFTLTSDLRISYLGHATKNGPRAPASASSATSATSAGPGIHRRALTAHLPSLRGRATELAGCLPVRWLPEPLEG